jgi:hypothetical protein
VTGETSYLHRYSAGAATRQALAAAVSSQRIISV